MQCQRSLGRFLAYLCASQCITAVTHFTQSDGLILLSVQSAICAVRNLSGVSCFCLNFSLYSDFH